MEHRGRGRKRSRSGKRRFYISEKHDPTRTVEAVVPPTAPVALSDTPLPQCSQNWRALSQQLGLPSKRKSDRPPTQSEPRTKSILRRSTQDHRHTSHSSISTQRSRPDMPTASAVCIDGSEMGESVERERFGDQKRRVKCTIPEADISIGKCVSLDCEMVGTGPTGDSSMLARCSIVNHHGNPIYDKFVAPMEKVTDYRTPVSGIRPRDLADAPAFSTVQKEVSELLKGKIIVGHSIQYDLKALLLSHPKMDIRDTAKYRPFKDLAGGRSPSLKKLAKEVLEIDIQEQEHDSVEDARVTMRLYQLHKREWESRLKARQHYNKRTKH